MENRSAHSTSLDHFLRCCRLLDLGFEKDVVEILEFMDKSSTQPRQTVLLSATLTSRVTRLATLSLNQPLSVGLDPPPEQLQGGQEPGEETEEEYAIPSQLVQSYLKGDLQRCRGVGGRPR